MFIQHVRYRCESVCFNSLSSGVWSWSSVSRWGNIKPVWRTSTHWSLLRTKPRVAWHTSGDPWWVIRPSQSPDWPLTFDLMALPVKPRPLYQAPLSINELRTKVSRETQRHKSPVPLLLTAVEYFSKKRSQLDDFVNHSHLMVWYIIIMYLFSYLMLNWSVMLICLF